GPAGRILSFDFPVLSPVARYGIQSLRLQGQSVAQQLQDRLETDRPEGVLIDVTRVKAPIEPLPCTPAGQAKLRNRLTELPTIGGIIAASHTAGAIQVYASGPLAIAQDFEVWADRYQAIDPSMDRAKAAGILESVWEGDRERFALLLALECRLQGMVFEQVRLRPSRLDALFLVIYQALEVLSCLLEQGRLYVDGTEALWALLTMPAIALAFGDRFPVDYRSHVIPGELMDDIAYLGHCGLLYVVTRLERVRNAFLERPKYGSTGWGRQLFRRLAESAGESLVAPVRQAVEALLVPHAGLYREYFAQLDIEGPAEITRRRELRRQMPVAVTL
ncbi:MAG: hypothetical protein KGR26_14865, partial [Cyanobacteria bacterium REEB65]|nr:hypothetical protein [Cyanobacteria bacterium REEB65]